MSTYINHVIVAGVIVKDPEFVTYGQQGKEMAKFPLALNKPSRGGRRNTIFVNVSVFGSSVTFIKNYLGKGSAVLCNGELNYSTWKDKLGEERRELAMTAFNVSGLDRGDRSDELNNADNSYYEAPQDVAPFPRGDARFAPGADDDTPPF